MCVFNDKIIAARDLNAFNLSGDAKSIHLHALRLERYLCSAKFKCFQPCFRAKKDFAFRRRFEFAASAVIGNFESPSCISKLLFTPPKGIS